MRYNQCKSKVARAPSVTASPCHLPPGGRLCYRPTVHPKGITHYALKSKACEKEHEQIISAPFVVGRGFISRRIIKFIPFTTAAASHRPTSCVRLNLLYRRCAKASFSFWVRTFPFGHKYSRLCYCRSLCSLFIPLSHSLLRPPGALALQA